MIITERLILRRWRDSDLEPFVRLNADERVTRHLQAPMKPPETEAWMQRISEHFEAHGFGLWVVEVRGGDAFAGITGLQRTGFSSHFTPSVEVAWRLLPASWGLGYATEAARAVIRHGLFDLGLDEVVSFTVPDNRASWRVMERAGMVRDRHGDFDHPRLPEGHPLRRHILYRAKASA